MLKKIESGLRNDLTLKGFEHIEKVYAKKYQVHGYHPITNEYEVTDDNWMIETDGVGLSKIFPVEMVEFRKTISNDIIEISFPVTLFISLKDSNTIFINCSDETR